MNSLPTSFRGAANAVASANASSGGWLWFAVYLVIALVVLYWLYGWLFASAENVETVLSSARAAPPATELKKTEMIPLKTKLTGGGEFTISTWLYLEATSAVATADKARPIFTLANSKGGADNNALVAALYPNLPHLMLRMRVKGAPTGDAAGEDYTYGPTFLNLTTTSAQSQKLADQGAYHPLCDVFDVDMQRWTLLTLVVSGRVVDVYMDGKLSRSCVLPGVPDISRSGDNVMTLYPGMGGRYSAMRVYDAALTPDRVWGLYAAGPTLGNGAVNSFAGYLASKLGLNITWLGSDGQQQVVGV